MTTTNHIGEDAANGAMGEREAFEIEWKHAGWGDADTKNQCFHFWQARAALTAEKVAGPVGATQEGYAFRCDGKLWVVTDPVVAMKWQAQGFEVTPVNAPQPSQPAQSGEGTES